MNILQALFLFKLIVKPVRSHTSIKKVSLQVTLAIRFDV